MLSPFNTPNAGAGTRTASKQERLHRDPPPQADYWCGLRRREIPAGASGDVRRVLFCTDYYQVRRALLLAQFYYQVLAQFCLAPARGASC